MEKYKIDDTISKSTEDIRLWQTEKGVIDWEKTIIDPIQIHTFLLYNQAEILTS